jgi:acetyl-CoA synthetase
MPIRGAKALDLEPGDIYWCTADPGWVTGTSYGIISPLVNRVTMLIDEAEFDLDRWYSARSSDEKVEVWYTAPTAIRMMMRAGAEAAPRLRFLVAEIPRLVGRAAEPRGRGLEREGLRPALPRQLVADRDRRHHDRQPPRHGGAPGSMGKPLPGIEAGIVEKTRTGCDARTRPGEVGELALRPGWPSMMRTYLHEPARYDKCFARRLVPVGRSRDAGRRRVFLVRRPRRRPDQDLRPPDRPLRGRKRADRA